MMLIEIKTEYIKLDSALKYCGVAENGAHPKELILDGEVTVNGEVGTMRGKKLRKGDKVTFDGMGFEII